MCVQVHPELLAALLGRGTAYALQVPACVCLCARACMRACMHTCVCARVCDRADACTSVRICVCTHMCVYVCVHTDVWHATAFSWQGNLAKAVGDFTRCACVCACTHVDMHARTHTHTHACTRELMYTRTNAHAQSCTGRLRSSRMCLMLGSGAARRRLRWVRTRRYVLRDAALFLPFAVDIQKDFLKKGLRGHTCACVHVHACTHADMQIHKHTCWLACWHAHAHTHTRACTHHAHMVGPLRPRQRHWRT